MARQADKIITMAALCQIYHGFCVSHSDPQPSTLTPVYAHHIHTCTPFELT